MLLRYSLGLEAEARAIESAVMSVLEEGYRTADLTSGGTRPVSTSEMGRLVTARIRSNKG